MPRALRPAFRVLGFDPGIRVTGYGCVEGDALGDVRLVEAGTIRPSRASGMDLSSRLADIARDVLETTHRLAPTHAAVETIFTHGAHPHTAVVMAHTRGAMLSWIQTLDLPLIELRPAEVKKSLTGRGHATKRDIQHAIQARFQLDRLPTPHDVADALAIALGAVGRLLAPLPATGAAPRARRSSRPTSAQLERALRERSG